MGRHGGGGSPDPEIEPHPRRWLILYILCLSLTMVVISMSSLNVALPSIQRELGAGGSDLQWIVDAYVLVFAGLLLPFGALGDRWGRKRVLVIGMTLFGILSALAAFSTSPGQIIGLRGVAWGWRRPLVMRPPLIRHGTIYPCDLCRLSNVPSAVANLGGIRPGRVGGLGPRSAGSC